MASTQSSNIYLRDGYAKVQKVTQEHLVLDNAGDMADEYGNHYRMAYDVDENSGEDLGALFLLYLSGIPQFMLLMR